LIGIGGLGAGYGVWFNGANSTADKSTRSALT
jgi:hypothetical protein